VATLVGLALNFVRFDPIRSLFIAAVINGLLAAPVMALMMLMTRSPKIMGDFTLPLYLQLTGWIGTIAMFAASLAFLISTLK
jgi:Mn2+/Fe2+ NRAMP family transporter